MESDPAEGAESAQRAGRISSACTGRRDAPDAGRNGRLGRGEQGDEGSENGRQRSQDLSANTGAPAACVAQRTRKGAIGFKRRSERSRKRSDRKTGSNPEH